MRFKTELFNCWIYQENAARLKIKNPEKYKGDLPVKIVVKSVIDGKRKMKHTNRVCTAEVFSALFPKLNDSSTRETKKINSDPKWIDFKKDITDQFDKVYDTVKNIKKTDKLNDIWTAADVVAKAFKKDVVVESGAEVTTIEYHFERYIKENPMLSRDSVNRMRSSCRSFNKFKPDTTIHQINKNYLTRWENWLRNEDAHADGKKRTWKTINGYCKNLQTVLIDVASDSRYGYSSERIPIGKGKTNYNIPVPKKNEAKIPKYLEEEDLEKFKNYVPANKKEEISKDVWFLSYYLGGCNCVDLVNFRKSNIQEEHDQLVFYRNKNRSKPSKNVSRVPLTPAAKELIKKYKPKPATIKGFSKPEDITKQFASTKNNNSGAIGGIFYLLNFHQYSKNNENTASNLRSYLNDDNGLKQISEKLKMKTSLNFQMARHTCFSNLQREGATFSEIREISGHGRMDILMDYLNKLKPSQTRKAMLKI